MYIPKTEEDFLPNMNIKATEDLSLAAYRERVKELHGSNVFYLYIHHYGDHIFYVGSGHGNRAFRTTSHRNHGKKWSEVVKAHGKPAQTILRAGLTKEEAAKAEKSLIAWYRSIGEPIVNDHDGGSIPSAEASAKGGWTLLKRAATIKAARAWSKRVKQRALEFFPRINMKQEVFAL
jgi:hypothetical protein